MVEGSAYTQKTGETVAHGCIIRYPRIISNGVIFCQNKSMTQVKQSIIMYLVQHAMHTFQASALTLKT